MTIEEYIKSRGLTVRLVAQKMGVSHQALYKYGKDFEPTGRTLEKVAKAMTALGAKTTVLDLCQARYGKNKES